MNQLEKEMLKAISTDDGIVDESRAKAAASLALRWIHIALEEGIDIAKVCHLGAYGYDFEREAREVKSWLQENNLSPSSSIKEDDKTERV